MRVIGASARMAASCRRVMGSGRIAGMLVVVPLLVVAAPSVASAGDKNGYSISLASSVVDRSYPSSEKPYPFRAANLNPNDINFQDCEDNIHLTFNLLEQGAGSDILQVWAGTTDCTQTTARTGAESPFCWQVAPQQEFVENATIDIYARSLTRYIDTTLQSVPNGGNPVIGAGQPEAACRTQTSQGQVPLSIYFMFVPNPNDATPDASYAYALNAALVGPQAPTNLLVAETGSAALSVDWTPPVDATVQGFQVLVVDNGVAGADGGGGACASNVLVDTFSRNVSLPSGGGTVAAGISEVDVTKYLGGTVGGNTVSNFDVASLPGNTPLIAGHRYAVAVAGFDDDGNVGLLSNVGCEIAVDDPSGSNGSGGSSGGGAGAGGCTMGRAGTKTTGSALGVVFGAALLGVARRRRRGRDASEG